MSDWLPDRKLPDARTQRGAFLFLVGVILNQNISGVLAWRGVGSLDLRIDIAPDVLGTSPIDKIEAALREPPAVHPFGRTMARAISSAAIDVCRDYAGDAREIWRPANNSRAEVTRRLTKFRQIGRHKAEVATYLLAEVYDELDIVTPEGVEQVCPALLTYLGAR